MAGMSCSSCGTENPPGARFCMSCGAALAPSCPRAAPRIRRRPKFCIECGTSLTATPGGRAAPRLPTAPAAETLPEERRNATVLFADLSGYTAVAERMDPEAVKSLVDRALRRLGQEVDPLRRPRRQVHRRQRDGRLRRPDRARGRPRARGARGARDAGGDGRDQRGDRGPGRRSSFLLRVGINSGEVLAGQVGDEYTVIGDPVNVAARLQAAARPGSVTVGEITYRLNRRRDRVRASSSRSS